MSKTLVKKLREVGSVQTGDFLLRSGKRSTIYCDVKKSFGHPMILQNIAEDFAPLVPNNATCIAASGYGGIPIAIALSMITTLPLALVRDKVKEHGTKQSIDGYIPSATDKVVVIDDVFMTGSSIIDTLTKLAPTKATVLLALVVVRRSDVQISIPVTALITENELCTI